VTTGVTALDRKKPLGTGEVLAELRAFWDSGPHEARFQPGSTIGRIAGSERDQPVPEGTSNPYWVRAVA
jgi:hypothetical protein